MIHKYTVVISFPALFLMLTDLKEGVKGRPNAEGSSHCELTTKNKKKNKRRKDRPEVPSSNSHKDVTKVCCFELINTTPPRIYSLLISCKIFVMTRMRRW